MILSLPALINDKEVIYRFDKNTPIGYYKSGHYTMMHIAGVEILILLHIDKFENSISGTKMNVEKLNPTRLSFLPLSDLTRLRRTYTRYQKEEKMFDEVSQGNIKEDFEIICELIRDKTITDNKFCQDDKFNRI